MNEALKMLLQRTRKELAGNPRPVIREFHTISHASNSLSCIHHTYELVSDGSDVTGETRGQCTRCGDRIISTLNRSVKSRDWLDCKT